MNEPTCCEFCDHVHAESRKQNPGRWLCVKHRRVPGGSFIAPNAWIEHEPYLRCVHTNAGACPLFTPRRNGKPPEPIDVEG